MTTGPNAPLVLDLFCGGGGAADGYARAGFRVVGVDHDPQPSYPYEFIRADALAFLARFEPDRRGFALVHASPPCQGYSLAVSSWNSPFVPHAGSAEPRLIEPVRVALQRLGVPYVIENVRDARSYLQDPIMLCSTMFALPIPRHRWFETSFAISPPIHPGTCRGVAKRYAEANGIEYRDMSVTGKGRHAGTSARWASFLGMDRVMRQRDYSEAIPPAYTAFIGGLFRLNHEPKEIA